MKWIRTLLCVGMILFLAMTPSKLAARAQESFVDPRFVRDTDRYTGSILLYHIVRQKPYAGSLTLWLKKRAEAYEKKHKGTYIEIEGMDETTFFERLESGRTPDAYSFFSGTLYRDRLRKIDHLNMPYRDGLFQTEVCVPYCYTGYCRLLKTPDADGGKRYYMNDVLAARDAAGENEASEEKADVLTLDLRRAADLIRYKDGFSLASIEPIDRFTDAVCWMGIDRNTDEAKADAILDFIAFLLTPDSQQTLNALGLLSVRADVKNAPPDASLKRVFKTYETVETVDPFLWQSNYDALCADAKLSRTGDAEAHLRFTNRLRECKE